MSKIIPITQKKSADLKALRSALAELEAEKILYKEIYALKTKPVEEYNHSTWQSMINSQRTKVILAKKKVKEMSVMYEKKYRQKVTLDYEGVHSL